jgi:hypothetical protein
LKRLQKYLPGLVVATSIAAWGWLIWSGLAPDPAFKPDTCILLKDPVYDALYGQYFHFPGRITEVRPPNYFVQFPLNGIGLWMPIREIDAAYQPVPCESMDYFFNQEGR